MIAAFNAVWIVSTDCSNSVASIIGASAIVTLWESV